MNKCCHETYKLLIKELIYSIEVLKPKTVHEVIEWLGEALLTMEMVDANE